MSSESSFQICIVYWKWDIHWYILCLINTENVLFLCALNIYAWHCILQWYLMKMGLKMYKNQKVGQRRIFTWTTHQRNVVFCLLYVCCDSCTQVLCNSFCGTHQSRRWSMSTKIPSRQIHFGRWCSLNYVFDCFSGCAARLRKLSMHYASVSRAFFSVNSTMKFFSLHQHKNIVWRGLHLPKLLQNGDW